MTSPAPFAPAALQEYAMNNGTHLTIIGNLTRAPAVRYTTSGLATSTFSVAVNRRVPTRGNPLTTTNAVSFFNVVAFGLLAENVSASLTQGDRVVVHGRLDQRVWMTNTEQPERRTSYEIVADEVSPSLRWVEAELNRSKRSRGQMDESAARLEAMVNGDDADQLTALHGVIDEPPFEAGGAGVSDLDHVGDPAAIGGEPLVRSEVLVGGASDADDEPF